MLNACYAVKIFKSKPLKSFKQGGARARCAGAGSAFDSYDIAQFKTLSILITESKTY